jgi:hypothetical protein
MHSFCTYFDQNYLVRGLTLYRSLERHANPFLLWALCFDDVTYETLLRLDLPNLRPISLQAFERDDDALLATKAYRSQVEYYFTCTPSWILYVLDNLQSLDSVTYLDADLYFYSNPQPIYDEMGDNSVLVVAHRFPQALRDREEYGIYNVGFLTLRNDSNGRICLQWWREKCLEWCYDRVEGGRFADQKYLDDWPARFPRVAVLEHRGAGLAPWNVDNYSLSVGNGRVLVDSEPLVFFHFHGLKQLSRRLYDPGLARFGAQASSVLKQDVYKPYIRGLSESVRSLSQLVDQPRIHLASIRHRRPTTDSSRNEGNLLDGLAKNVQERIVLAKRVYHGDLWFVIGGRIL